jgi:hypothetical protein
MIKAIYDELAKDKPKNHFTVGIVTTCTTVLPETWTWTSTSRAL